MNTEQKYAIFYPETTSVDLEGLGHLFVKKLGKGAFGSASLVYSTDNKTLLVRKAISPNSVNLSNIANDIPEAALALTHPLIPKIEGVNSYDTLVPESMLRQQYKLHTILLEYCNRGDLQNLMQDYSIPPDVYNKAIWKVFRDLVIVIDFIHHSGVVHRDLHEGNIFLHWRADEESLEAKLGDFGISFNLGNIENGTERHRWRLHDWKALKELLADLEPMPSDSDADSVETGPSQCPCISEMHDSYGRPRPREATDPKLNDLGCMLEAMAPHASRTKGNVRVQELLDLIDDAASAYDHVNWSVLRPKCMSHQPKLFNTRSELIEFAGQKDIPGPFKIARVDHHTTRVLAVENETFHLHVPEPNVRNAINASHDDYYSDMVETGDIEGFWLHFWAAKALETGESYGPDRISPAYAETIFFDDPEWTIRLAKKSEMNSK
jgi:hypothetical protein